MQREDMEAEFRDCTEPRRAPSGFGPTGKGGMWGYFLMNLQLGRIGVRICLLGDLTHKNEAHQVARRRIRAEDA
jgi:hypothetical protein